MQMNSGIILSGQQPDFVNVLRQSNLAASEANTVQDQNALRQLYAEKGDKIAAGDQNALNALAMRSPQASLGIQDARQGLEAGQLNMDATRQRMDVLTAQDRRAVEAHAASLDATQRQAQAQQIERGLMAGIQAYQAGDLAGLNAILQQAGEQPITSVDQFPAVAAKYKGVLDVMKDVRDFNAPDDPLSPQGKLADDLRNGKITPEQFNAANQESGTRVSVSPDGTMTFEEGVGVTQTKPLKTTEGEKSSAGYLSRMQASEQVLNDLADTGETTRSIASLIVGGTNFEGMALSDQQLKILQAQRDWVRAKLRKESGAVIGADEMAEEIRTYFPLPGEGESVAEQKRKARREAEKQFQIMAGGAAQDDGPVTADFSSMDAGALGAIDLDTLTPEQLNAYIARGTELGL